MSRPKRRRRAPRYLVIPRTREASLELPAPQLAAVLRDLERGERPADSLVRGGLRELRSIERLLRSRGGHLYASNAGVFAWLADHIDVLRWVLEQPHESELRLCSSCRRRPRHFGERCKRCAGDERPRGKVGEA